MASLEQMGIVVLDERPVFEKYLAATEDDRRTFVSGVLTSVDPVLKDTGGDVGKRNEWLRRFVET